MRDLSIVIPCRDDVRIKDCLASIDEEVEIVISLNGSTPQVERIILEQASKRRLDIVRLQTPNLAAALQAGSLAASSEAILYMDSDCQFLPGTIRRFRESLRRYEVVKGSIIFQSNSWLTAIIARSREHHTAERLTAYKPPLAVRCSIRERIGGYYFDERLHWREDSDLDCRIRQAGIPLYWDQDATISHPPLNIWQDLRSAHRYGVGLARARWYNIALTEVPRSVLSTYRSKGTLPALYMCLRNLVYTGGTLTEHAKLLLKGHV
jgi:glycosyltransferase involved in cell wall biosynthesis